MKKIKIQNNKNAGFSLVEMLVATAIFMSIMAIAVTSLTNIISQNKKAQAIKTTVDSVTFGIESISKEMRMGTQYYCASDGVNFSETSADCPLGSSKIRFKDASGQGIIYQFSTTSGTTLTKTTCGPATDGNNNQLSNSGPFAVCSSPVDYISADANVNIGNITFYILGADQESGYATSTQPRVIITASGIISSQGGTDTLGATSFNLQTTVSQRAVQ